MQQVGKRVASRQASSRRASGQGGQDWNLARGFLRRRAGGGHVEGLKRGPDYFHKVEFYNGRCALPNM